MKECGGEKGGGGGGKKRNTTIINDFMNVMLTILTFTKNRLDITVHVS